MVAQVEEDLRVYARDHGVNNVMRCDPLDGVFASASVVDRDMCVEERDDDVPSPKGAGVCDSSTQPFCTSKQAAPLPSASIAVSSSTVRWPSLDCYVIA